MTKKVEENRGVIYKRNHQRFLFHGDPSSSSWFLPKRYPSLVSQWFLQLLWMSNCLPLGMISNLPKHLGLLALYKDWRCVWDLQTCMKFIWLQINKAPLSKECNFQDKPMIPSQLYPEIRKTAACERTEKHEVLLSRESTVIHWLRLGCKLQWLQCPWSLPSENNTLVMTLSKCTFLLFYVWTFFFVVSQGTWERFFIIHPHQAFPSGQDIIHLTH